MNGLIRVPLPLLEEYDEDGNIVDKPQPNWQLSFPALASIERKPASELNICKWKPISDILKGRVDE
jgi:hypothetical protein